MAAGLAVGPLGGAEPEAKPATLPDHQMVPFMVDLRKIHSQPDLLRGLEVVALFLGHRFFEADLVPNLKAALATRK